MRMPLTLSAPRLISRRLRKTVSPVDYPSLDIKDIGEDKSLVFTASVVVEPDVELGEYKELKLKSPKLILPTRK